MLVAYFSMFCNIQVISDIYLLIGMKIISAGGSSKLLPKMSQSSTVSGTPVVVVSAGSSHSSTSNVTMVTRPITSLGMILV